MIPALIIGRGGSTGLPGKNTMKILGRPLMSYPIMAAKSCKYINNIYISTDDSSITKLAVELGAKIIARPAELCTKEALAEDAFRHGFLEIQKMHHEQIEFVVLLFCNSATIKGSYITQAIDILRSDSTLDSVCTVSCYNMWSPLRARKIDNHGHLVPFIDPSNFGTEVTCDRGSQGDSWYADCSLFVVRPYCLKKDYGDPPFNWLGKKIYPLKQWGGQDIDYHWQVPTVEYWLKEHGFTEDRTPYDAFGGEK